MLAFTSIRIWITWETQRRNHSLSNAFGAKLFQFDLKLNPISRYVVSLFKTLITFIKERPTLIFVQNPSLVLALFAVNYGHVSNIPIVVDAHTAGIFPLKGLRWWTNKIVLYIIRNAALTIVTNENIKNYVEQNKGTSFVLPDPIPDFIFKKEKITLKGKYNVLFICSYGRDEPYMEVIEAAKILNKDICIYISGNPKGKEEEFKSITPENVVLTGYLSENKFIQLLYSVDAIIDLTTREHCLLCGAYEAVAVEKPLIVSATTALREYFYKGTLYTNNTCNDLAEQIESAIINRDKLRQEIIELKKELVKEWGQRKEIFEKLLQKIENSA